MAKGAKHKRFQWLRTWWKKNWDFGTCLICLLAIVAGVTLYNAHPWQPGPRVGYDCGSIDGGGNATSAAFACVMAHYAKCDAAYIEQSFLGVDTFDTQWVVVQHDLLSGKCRLSLWESSSSNGVHFGERFLEDCADITREPYGLHLHGCGEPRSDVYVTSGREYDPTIGGTACGQVVFSQMPRKGSHLQPDGGQSLVIDPASAQRAESCFAQAFSACQPATLEAALQVAGTLYYDSEDPSLFVVEQYHGACSVTRLTEALYYNQETPDGGYVWNGYGSFNSGIEQCSDVKYQPPYLAVTCPSGTVNVPSGQRAAS